MAFTKNQIAADQFDWRIDQMVRSAESNGLAAGVSLDEKVLWLATSAGALTHSGARSG